MSDVLPPKPRLVGPKVRICIVASKYNEKYTDAMVEHASEELGELLPHARIDIIRVPGAYEIPVIVSNVIRNASPSCVIALGVVIKGATDHADMIGESVTQSLQQMAVDSLIPVIHEVLLVQDEKQAYARCIGDQLNRGREAARTAATMVEISNDLARSIGRPTGNK